jgi:hypothetical protein
MGSPRSVAGFSALLTPHVSIHICARLTPASCRTGGLFLLQRKPRYLWDRTLGGINTLRLGFQADLELIIR